MWSYYGTKKRIAKYYPSPQCDKIIEPFCGAAQYSLFGDNWKKEVVLYDKYSVIIDIWNYLIQSSREDILSLPNMYKDDGINVDDLDIPQAAKYLIGFCINSGSAQPKKTVAKYNSWNVTKLYIAENLYKIKHWKAFLADYNDIPNEKATWFIDPPYQNGGKYYRHHDIDYKQLSAWCDSRIGQVIICENSAADWHEFHPLVEMNGQLHKTLEVVYTRSV